MEFLSGQSLASRLHQVAATDAGREPRVVPAGRARDVGGARKGIVHRDLKPENIFWCPIR